MLNPLYDEMNELDELDELDEMDIVVPTLDIFDIEWWFKLPYDNPAHISAQSKSYLGARQQYLQSRLSKILLDDSIEVELNYTAGEVGLFISYECQFNNFLLYNVKYIARMLCAMFDVEYCRYSIANYDRDFEVSINYIEAAVPSGNGKVALD